MKGFKIPHSEASLSSEVFVFDADIGVPFMIINSDPIKLENGKRFHFFLMIIEREKVLFVIHDIFNSYFEFVDFYKDLAQGLSNTKIVLFNYPGKR